MSAGRMNRSDAPEARAKAFKGVGGGCVKVSQCNNTRDQGENGTKNGVSGTAVADFLDAHAILLTGEGERAERRGLQVGDGKGKNVERTRADPEGHVL